jgi:hypothetical protein
LENNRLTWAHYLLKKSLAVKENKKPCDASLLLSVVTTHETSRLAALPDFPILESSLSPSNSSFPFDLALSCLFVWLVADGWCWFVLREKYCWLVVGGWFGLREKYCWLVADKPSEQGADL